MSSLTPDPATAPPAFEEVLDRLDTIVQQLEGGGSSLEEALRLYEAFQPAEAALEAVKAIKPEAKPESAPTPRAK